MKHEKSFSFMGPEEFNKVKSSKIENAKMHCDGKR